MKVTIYVILFWSFVVSSCAAIIQKDAKEKQDVISIDVNDKYERGEQIDITVANATENDTIYIYEPQQIRMEKLEGEKWRKVRIRYCPCGASCPQPPEKQLLMPGNEFFIQWDQIEEWCGEKNEKGVPETHTAEAEKGLYRITIIYYKPDRNQAYKIVEEFEIVD
ncbi:MAG: hypothetical protein R6U04_01235 [Bacteroidales bacterium]